MKRLACKALSLLLLLACLNFVYILPASATSLTPEQIVAFQSTYTKDGKFVMPVTFGAKGSESAYLTDANNNVLDNYTSMLVDQGTTLDYRKSFAALSPGTYYLNVKFTYSSSYGLGDDKWVARKLKINHKGPAAKLAFLETYQTYTEEGDMKQVFNFSYTNAKGKKINYEVYDEYGTQFSKASYVAKSANGKCYYKWNYYSNKGGLMASDGTYILKYWVDGQTPKQQNFDVVLGEG